MMGDIPEFKESYSRVRSGEPDANGTIRFAGLWCFPSMRRRAVSAGFSTIQRKWTKRQGLGNIFQMRLPALVFCFIELPKCGALLQDGRRTVATCPDIDGLD